MPRPVSLFLLLLPLPLVAAIALAGGPAHARDGAYRGPSGSVPPGLREPSDPAPPPPPPPSGPPAGGRAPAPTVPTPPPPSPPPTTPRPPGAGALPPMQVMSFEAWPFWYEHNRDLLETSYRRAEEPHPDPAATAAYDAILKAAKGEGDPHPATRAAALIALGKIAHEAEHVALLRDVLARDASPLVRESAALGLGLLRRSARHAQFDTAVYDEARALLLAAAADEGNPARLRGFAALGLGLLGDQPTAQDPAATTKGLFDVLLSRPNNVDVPVGVVRALALQPRASFTAEQRRVLRDLAYDGKLGTSQAYDVLQARALETLGILGDAEDAARMASILARTRRTAANVKRSAVIGLGLLAAHVPLESRLTIVDTLLQAATGQKDASTRTFALGALVPALLYGSPDDRQAVLRRSLAPEVLLATAAYGSALERPYAALVLGWLLHESRHPPLPDTLADLQGKALRTLREGAAATDLPPRGRAAFALALGLTGDETHAPALTAILAGRANDKTLRAYAAVGLAYLDPSEDRLAAASAAREERSNQELRMLAARALGMMRVGDPDALAEELRDARNMGHKGEASVALARTGSPEARAALLRLATDPNETALTRAVAMAGLGRLLDPEFMPSLARLTMWMNYRASTDLVSAIYALL